MLRVFSVGRAEGKSHNSVDLVTIVTNDIIRFSNNNCLYYGKPHIIIFLSILGYQAKKEKENNV